MVPKVLSKTENGPYSKLAYLLVFALSKVSVLVPIFQPHYNISYVANEFPTQR